MPQPPIVVVHGGAGALGAELVDPARRGLREALDAGLAPLLTGGSALDAAVAAVRVLEDDETFNAGRGAVLTAAGTIEHNAAVADGTTRRAGAVASTICGPGYPVEVARAVMECTPHVLLVGAGAEAVARDAELAFEDPAWFVTARRAGAEGHGTVGAVALDADGHLAAATSTGGTPGQPPGRVGDSPILGAGTWADDRTCAVSATGHGEAFILAAFAHEVDALIRLGGLGLAAACEQALGVVAERAGRGGCVAVAPNGTIAMPFTTTGMYRGWIDRERRPRVAIFEGEEPA